MIADFSGTIIWPTQISAFHRRYSSFNKFHVQDDLSGLHAIQPTILVKAIIFHQPTIKSQNLYKPLKNPFPVSPHCNWLKIESRPITNHQEFWFFRKSLQFWVRRIYLVYRAFYSAAHSNHTHWRLSCAYVPADTKGVSCDQPHDPSDHGIPRNGIER